MDATKPYEFIGIRAMDATKPYEFIGFGAMHVTKPSKFIGFGAMDAPGGLESDPGLGETLDFRRAGPVVVRSSSST